MAFGSPADDALYERIGIVCDHGTVLRNQFRKLVKRSGNMFHILEIIKVVGIDIQNDLDFRLEIQEAVHVLACFRYEIVILPLHKHSRLISAQIAADQDRWLLVCISLRSAKPWMSLSFSHEFLKLQYCCSYTLSIKALREPAPVVISRVSRSSFAFASSGFSMPDRRGVDNKIFALYVLRLVTYI